MIRPPGPVPLTSRRSMPRSSASRRATGEALTRSPLALGAKGVHLYPLFYWNWPDSPDKVSPPLKQIERDWIWFEAWARYAWNPDIPEAEDLEAHRRVRHLPLRN